MTKVINLTKGQATLVDDSDLEMLSKYNWHTFPDGRRFYAIANVRLPNGSKKTIRMHRLILEAKEGEYIDHIDGDGLNNQRSNLRFCTKLENCRNRRLNSNSTSGYKGVTWKHKRKKWVARIQVDGKDKWLGYYDTAEEAARSYDRGARKYYGEFAKLNFGSNWGQS